MVGGGRGEVWEKEGRKSREASGQTPNLEYASSFVNETPN